MNRIREAVVLVPALAAAAALAGDAEKPAAPPCRAELLVETPAVRAGTETTIAVALVPDAGWHVYWTNPGESGIAPTVDWTLPEGFTVGALHWPAPRRTDTDGIVGYVYEGETLLLATLKVPAAAKPGDVTVSARVRWLVCRDVCEPGEAKLETKIAVKNAVPAADAVTSARFARARARLPRTLAAGPARIESTADRVTLSVEAPEVAGDDVRSVDFFPAEQRVLDDSAAVALESKDAGKLRVRLTPAPRRDEPVKRLTGVLVVTTATRSLAYEIDATAREPGSAGDKGPR